MPRACPDVQAAFRRAVNMSPDAIRAWARDPRARLASYESTRRRLPGLADLRAKPASSWTGADCSRAQRVVSFVARHTGQMARFGCTPRETVALRNWGHAPRCPLPPRGS